MKFLSLLALLFGVSLAQAQHCGSVVRRAYPVSYHAPQVVVEEKVIVKEVITPVGVPVLVPAAVFQYLPALQVPVQQQPVAPVQVQAQAPQKCPTPEELDKIIQARVEAALRERNVSNGPPPLLLPGQPTQPPLARPQAAPTDDELLQQSANILAENKCYTCHTQGEKVSGNVVLFAKSGDELEFNPNVDKKKIYAAVTPAKEGEAPLMPPTAKKDPKTALSPEQVEVLRQWASRP